MAFIEPTTTIHFCSNVPLDNRYINTLLFDDRGQQQLYFAQRTTTSMTGCYYQREGRSIRASVPISQLYNCNYLYFINPNFENRYFYAFIKNLTYINNEVTEVTFEIDFMQTYFLDCQLHQCFIVRGHTSDDIIGKNQVPETLETGEYIITEWNHTQALEPMCIVVAATVDEEGNPVEGGYYSLVYSGVKLHVFREAAAVDAFLKKLTDLNKADAVVNIFMMPYTFSVAAGTAPKLSTFRTAKPYSTIDGYTPQNKKLFTYPYNILHISNGEGISADLRYEFFSTDTCEFNVWGSMCTTPQSVCVPTHYKGAAINWDEKIVLDGWPQCAWNIDTYKAWLAQNANLLDWQDNTNLMRERQISRAYDRGAIKSVVNVLGSAVTSGAAGAAAGAGLGAALGPIGAGVGGVIGGLAGIVPSLMGASDVGYNAELQAENLQNQIEGTLAMREDHATTPPQAVGGGSSTVMQGLNLKTFFIYKKQIRAEFAKIIDQYFTMYGYAQHKVATPNIDARTRFTYIQTTGSNVTGNAPVWAVAAINSIFDHGITFWRDYSGVGNYLFPNPTKPGGDY